MPPTKRNKRTVIRADGLRVDVENGDDDKVVVEGDAVNLDELKRKCTRPDIWCYGCKYHFAPSIVGSSDPDQVELWRKYQEHKSTMQLEDMSEMLETVYNNTVYVKFLKQGKFVLPWPKHMVMLHLDPASNHMFDQETDIRTDIQNFRVIAPIIQSRMFVRKKDSDEMDYRKEAFDDFLKITAEKQKLWAKYEQIKN